MVVLVGDVLRVFSWDASVPVPTLPAEHRAPGGAALGFGASPPPVGVGMQEVRGVGPQ